MATRSGDEASSRDWRSPTDVDGVLHALGTSREDSHEAKVRVGLFLLTHGGRRMPAELRAARVAAGVLDPEALPQPDANRRDEAIGCRGLPPWLGAH
jgi:hypothetical protein